jgi:hypothetical protein
LENIWKDAVVALSKNCPAVFLEGLRKTAKLLLRIAGVPALIQTDKLSNTIHKSYRYAQPS